MKLKIFPLNKFRHLRITQHSHKRVTKREKFNISSMSSTYSRTSSIHFFSHFFTNPLSVFSCSKFLYVTHFIYIEMNGEKRNIFSYLSRMEGTCITFFVHTFFFSRAILFMTVEKGRKMRKKNERSYHHIVVKCNDARGHTGPIASHHRHVLAITMYGYFLTFFFKFLQYCLMCLCDCA